MDSPISEEILLDEDQPPSNYNIQANFEHRSQKTIGPNNIEDFKSLQNDIEDDDSSSDDIAGMFVTVNVEVDEEADYEDEIYSEQSACETSDGLGYIGNDSLLASASVTDSLKSKEIIATLAQKLNTKLNSVVVPRPVDSFLACLEPNISVATSRTTSAGGVYVCPWCPLTSFKPEALEEHIKLSHRQPTEEKKESGGTQSKISPSRPPSRPHTCDVCGKTFARSWHLARHFIIHTGERPFLCVICGEGFASASELRIHHKQHSGGSHFECKTCVKTFTTYQELKLHVSSHTSQGLLWSSSGCSLIDFKSGNKFCTCPDCGEAFDTNRDLIIHEQTHHKESFKGRKTICELCGLSFSVDELDGHMEVHGAKKLFPCQLCTKSFSCKNDMQAHLQSNHKVEELESIEKEGLTCPFCHKEFNHLNPLKRHLLLHSAKKPFKCTYCDEIFRGANDLRVHKRVHTGERPFICPECGESFTQKGNLTVHIRTHTGEKPFECHVCKRCFLKSSNLKEHMKVHQDGRGKRTGCAAGGRPPRFQQSLQRHVEGSTTDLLDSKSKCNGGVLKFQETIAKKLKATSNFKETIAERLKETGVLSFGGGKIQLKVINGGTSESKTDHV